jgi:hypothetical protein
MIKANCQMKAALGFFVCILVLGYWLFSLYLGAWLLVIDLSSIDKY